MELSNKVMRLKIPISDNLSAIVIKLASFLIGNRKSKDIFSSFTEKIVPSNDDNTIRLETKFSQVYK